MQHDKHHILPEEGEHPSMELLRQYQEDVLPPDLSHQVEKHLLACELCADVLEGMTLSGADETKAAVGDINQSIAGKTKQERKEAVVPAWQIAAAVLLLLCASFLVVYYNYNRLTQEENTIAAEQEIDRAMDLSLPAAPDILTEIPDSAGESERENIASAPPPTVVSKRNVPPITNLDRETVNSVVEKEVMDEEILEEDERYTIEALQKIDTPSIVVASPAVADSKVSATASVPTIKADALSIAPESTSVARSLQGKAPGIAIRGLSTLRENDAAGRVVSGQVLSEDGQPLPGVTVQLKGTGTGTTTDAAGNYVLPVTGKKPTLLFQYIGFASAEKAVAESTATIDVNLSPDNKALSEVVVTGYSTATASEPPAVVAAKPASGRKAYRKYLKENLRITADTEGEHGRVVVGFTVTASGKISEVKVLNSLCPACDAEAVRLVKEGPAWHPATQAGNPIPQQVKVSVQFKQ
ncbi:TonB family protein [Pontibacter toksunensis]|uniref:TonB family protein n=1 Tax=Pontibacter toksunensis TaxID=1332631 RepID=A0ABW6BR46_9BACT